MPDTAAACKNKSGENISVSPSKVAALRGDPSTHSSSFLAEIISHILLSTAQDDGSGKIEKPSPHGEGGEHSEPDRVLTV